MALVFNERQHWQIRNGAELCSGDPVELERDGQWLAGEVVYRPRRGYVLRLEIGEEVELEEEMALRLTWK